MFAKCVQDNYLASNLPAVLLPCCEPSVPVLTCCFVPCRVWTMTSVRTTCWLTKPSWKVTPGRSVGRSSDGSSVFWLEWELVWSQSPSTFQSKSCQTTSTQNSKNVSFETTWRVCLSWAWHSMQGYATILNTPAL